MNVNAITSSLNFTGKTLWTGKTKSISPQKEANVINNYAKFCNCDLVVLHRTYYINNKGNYKTIAVKFDETTGTNRIFYKIFDFQNPKRNIEKEIDLIGDDITTL